MATANLIRTAPPEGRRPLGVQGQQVIDAYRQIDSVLRSRLGADHADLFARPERKSDGGFDWYAAWPGAVTPLSALPSEERAAHEAEIARRLEAVRDFARAQGERGGAGATLAEMLDRATMLANTDDAWLVDGRPVLTFWGFAPEDPAHAPVTFTPVRALPAAPAAATVAAVAVPVAGASWWRWLLLLLLLGLLAFLTLKACEPLPPEIVEREVADTSADDRLAELQRQREELDALLADLGRKREEQLAACVLPPEQDIAKIPEVEVIEPKPEPIPEPKPAPVQPDPKPLPELPALPDIPKTPPVAKPAPKPQPTQNACTPDRPKYKAPEVVLVVDASGSMEDSIPGASSRMQASKGAIGNLVQSMPGDIDIGLIEFTDCNQVKRDRFYSPSERQALIDQVNRLSPTRGTPLELAVRRAGLVISESVEGVIVVVTDGSDSCNGDPCAAARAIASSKPNVKINVIDISGSATNPSAQCMAQATGGRVFQPNSAAEMQVMVQQASEQPDARKCQ
ncbi:MAG: VWA domain-containing protein [Rhodospirillales bacterium]